MARIDLKAARIDQKTTRMDIVWHEMTLAFFGGLCVLAFDSAFRINSGKLFGKQSLICAFGNKRQHEHEAANGAGEDEGEETGEHGGKLQ
jgi:hypothetical protein